MQIAPRYDDEPVIHLDCSLAEVRPAFLRQRRRLAEVFTRLTAQQWDAPSRCDAWTAKGVALHLVDTDRFWHASVRGALAGAPTRYMEGFDPKATPELLVAAGLSTDPTEVVERYSSATQDLCSLVESLEDGDGNLLGEAPPGHMAVTAVLHHALWDSWVHERDVLLPLGATPVEDPDEILTCLRYGAALSPAFATTSHPGRTGRVVLSVRDPDACYVVDVDDSVRVRSVDGADRAVADGAGMSGSALGAEPEDSADTIHVSGPAVEVLEALSVRGTFPEDTVSDDGVPGDPGPGDSWLLRGLTEVFETPG